MFYFGAVSDLSGSWTMQRQQQTVKNQMLIASQEVTTGMRDAAKVANAGDVGRVLNIDRALTVNERYSEGMKTGRVRMEATQETLTVLRENARDVSVSLLANLTGRISKTTELQAATAVPALESAVARLNGSIAGRSLFSGANIGGAALNDAETLMTDVEAIMMAAPDAATGLADVETYFNAPGGGFETNMYVGSTADAPWIDMGQGDSVSGAVRADDPALRDTLRQLSVIAAVSRNPAAFTEADKLVYLRTSSEQNLDTADDLIRLQEAMGFDQERLDRAATRSEAERLRLMTSRVNLTEADQYESAGRFEQLQVQLQTVFAVTARLGDLSLVNYLR